MPSIGLPLLRAAKANNGLVSSSATLSTSAGAIGSVACIQERIAPLQARLFRHPLYASIRSVAHLRLFMESHVFAVWDFMSLLKSLQRSLTSVQTPWVPTGSRSSRRFINEIVLGEESDVYDGSAISHFEVYLDAMADAGASTVAIDALVAAVTQGHRSGVFSLEEPYRARRPRQGNSSCPPSGSLAGALSRRRLPRSPSGEKMRYPTCSARLSLT